MTCQPESGAFGEGEIGLEDQTEFLAGTVTNDWHQRRRFATRKIKGPRATRAGFLANAKSVVASARYQAGTENGPNRIPLNRVWQDACILEKGYLMGNYAAWNNFRALIA